MYGGSGAGPGHRGLAQAIDWAAAAAWRSICKKLHFVFAKSFTSPECTPTAQNWLALTVAGAIKQARGGARQL